MRTYLTHCKSHITWTQGISEETVSLFTHTPTNILPLLKIAEFLCNFRLCRLQVVQIHIKPPHKPTRVSWGLTTPVLRKNRCGAGLQLIEAKGSAFFHLSPGLETQPPTVSASSMAASVRKSWGRTVTDLVWVMRSLHASSEPVWARLWRWGEGLCPENWGAGNSSCLLLFPGEAHLADC